MAIGFPALARGEAARTTPAAGIVAYDNGFKDASGSDPSDSTVEIQAGQEVSFSYPSGSSYHNVAFDAGQPSACTQTAGVVYGAVPPLPSIPGGHGWAGSCRFDTPGTYTFLCQAHPTEMKGTVIVDAPTPTPTPTGTATPTPTASPTPTPTPTPSPTPTATATATPSPEPASAAVQAHDFFFQDASQASPDDSSVTIAPGQSVSFSYPAGGNVHNVEFDGAQPASCIQTAGTALGAVPPLPSAPLGHGWEGQCRFDTAGTYTFVCQAHRYMTGTVVVQPAGSTPTPTPTAQASTRPPAQPAPTPKPWASLDRPASTSVASFMRGKLRMTARCAAVSSGTLTLSVSKSQARRLKLKGTTIATAKARCLGNGELTVTIRPTAAAKRALAHYRRPLAVTARLTLSGARGAAGDKRSLTLGARR